MAFRTPISRLLSVARDQHVPKTPSDNLKFEAAYVLPERISMVDPFRYAAADAIWRRTGCRSFAASAGASRESQAVPVALAHLECQGAHVFIQVIEF